MIEMSRKRCKMCETVKMSEIQGVVHGFILRPIVTDEFGPEPCTNCGEANVIRCIVMDNDENIIGLTSLCMECAEFGLNNQRLIEQIKFMHGFIEFAKIYMAQCEMLRRLVIMNKITIMLD
jgi:hypothetical protein